MDFGFNLRFLKERWKFSSLMKVCIVCAHCEEFTNLCLNLILKHISRVDNYFCVIWTWKSTKHLWFETCLRDGNLHIKLSKCEFEGIRSLFNTEWPLILKINLDWSHSSSMLFLYATLVHIYVSPSQIQLVIDLFNTRFKNMFYDYIYNSFCNLIGHLRMYVTTWLNTWIRFVAQDI
jgi:hypothetical protein